MSTDRPLGAARRATGDDGIVDDALGALRGRPRRRDRARVDGWRDAASRRRGRRRRAPVGRRGRDASPRASSTSTATAAAGASYDDGPDAIRAARALHRAHGTTRAVVSLVTAPLETLERRAAMVADLVRRDADILGSHLEGPFLDPAHKGAHDETLLRAPRRRQPSSGCSRRGAAPSAR